MIDKKYYRKLVNPTINRGRVNSGVQEILAVPVRLVAPFALQ